MRCADRAVAQRLREQERKRKTDDPEGSDSDQSGRAGVSGPLQGSPQHHPDSQERLRDSHDPEIPDNERHHGRLVREPRRQPTRREEECEGDTGHDEDRLADGYPRAVLGAVGLAGSQVLSH